MQLNKLEPIPKIASKNHFSIFAFPDSIAYPKIAKALPFSPNDKNTIPIDTVREIELSVRSKQSRDVVFLIQDADTLTEAAANSFLKLLEEPGEHIHFVFFTRSPQKLLPTIKSRAHNYNIKGDDSLDQAPNYPENILDLAKKYIAASPKTLIQLSQELARDREKSLLVVSAAIDLLYRSYFKTANPKFLDKLQDLDKTYLALAKNGHVRLQLVANML